MKKSTILAVSVVAVLMLSVVWWTKGDGASKGDESSGAVTTEDAVNAKSVWQRESSGQGAEEEIASATLNYEEAVVPEPTAAIAPPLVVEAVEDSVVAAPAQDGGRERSLADILEGADLSDPNIRDQVVQQARAQELAKRTRVIEKAKQLGLPLRVEQEDGRVIELIGFAGDEPIYRTTHNANAAISSGADQLATNSYQLDGSGVRVGVWDGGSARSSHQELSQNTNLENAGAQLSSHATHVAGTIGASGATSNARGMAPGVQIHSYDWNSDLSEMLAAGAASPSDTNRVSLSNHSYGILGGYMWDGSYWRWYGDGTGSGGVEQDFGRYNSMTRDWDALAKSLPYLTIFKAAGNDRTDNPSSGRSVYSPSGTYLFSYSAGSSPGGDGAYRGGYECQSYSALAKNIITVGAVNDAVTGGNRNPGAASMSNFSCWGPTDDGRIKPDLVANGVNLYSPVSDSDNAYSSYSGTSMATPSACGSAALLVELYQREFNQGLMRSSLLKGLLIHTADDVGTPGPDYQNGWGLIDVQAAADLMLAHKASLATPRMIEAAVTTATPNYSHEFEWDGSSPIRATLCWTDPAGATQSAHDSRAPNLVNDLDLTVTAPNGQVYRPFVMPFVGSWTQGAMAQAATTGKNDVDNVEQVLLMAPPQVGDYTVRVSVDGGLTNGRQAFALVLSGVASGSGNQNSRILRLNGDLAFGAVEVGQSASRSVTLQNAGNTALSVSRVDLPTGFSGTWSGNLAAGASASFNVTFSPGVTGPFSGSLRVYSDADNGVVSLAASGEGVAGTVIQSLTKAVPVSGLSGQAGSERYYRISVPANQSALSFEINGSGDADLYVRYGSLPSISEWDYRPYLSSSNETVEIAGPAAGDWYVMVRGYSAYSGLTLVGSYESPVLSTRVIELQGDLDYGNIPVGDTVARNLTIRNNGNASLTVSGISLPSGFSGNWSGSIPAGGSQLVALTFAPLAEQVYLGQVSVASNKTSGQNTRSISGTGVITQVGLQNGVTVGPFSGLAGSMSFFYIDVPANQTSLSVQLQGTDGEADLYLRYGSAPTLEDYDRRSSAAGHDDTLEVDAPSAGRWYILLHAVTQISDIRLSVEYQQAAPSQRIIRMTESLDFGTVRVNQSASRNLTIYNDGDVALSVFGLTLPQGFSAAWSGSIQPGDSRVVAVTFRPTAVGSYTGLLSVQSDATSGISTAALAGQGVADDSVVDLGNGIPLSGLDGSEDSQRIYRISVPASATLLSVSITGSSGDADLYLRHGSVPTLNEYDYSPYLSGSNETVDVDHPAAGDWFIMVHAYSQYSGLTLRASYASSGAGVEQFTNSSAIALNDSGPGSLYPSEIEVAGLSGAIEKVTITLHELSHTYPSDIDLLLVGPDGTAVLLMSDAGGGSDITNLDLVFDDDASSGLNESSQLISGIYRPTNFGSGDFFSGPAPGGSYDAALSAFNELDPNGTWALYFYDDAGLDSGALNGGWTLEIETDASAAALPDLTDGSGTHSLSPSDAEAGDTMSFAVDIANAGGQASGAFELRLQFSADTSFTDADTTLQVVAVPSIEAGGIYALNTNFTVPGLAAGEYYLGWQIDYDAAVEESDEDNNDWYRISPIQITSSASEDAYEENDTPATAYPFNQEGAWLSEISGSGIQSDDDWYRVEAEAGAVLQVSCLFNHNEGDIDLELYDASLTLLSDAYSVTDNETIELTVPATGSYYILVYYDNAGNDYDLRWQTYGSSLAPEADAMAAGLPGRTFYGATFTSATRFDWEGYLGNWDYERTSSNQGLIIQTYDLLGNDPDIYREEIHFTFTTTTTGSYLYREYDAGVLDYEDSGTFDFPWLAATPTTWYDSSVNLGGGWRWFDWFGSFNVSNDPWIFHAQHGWLYPFADGPDDIYFWDMEMESILWTSENVYPALYRFSDGKWIFYQKGSSNPRWFVNLLTGQWEQW